MATKSKSDRIAIKENKTMIKEVVFVILLIFAVWGMFATKTFAANDALNYVNTEKSGSSIIIKGDLGGNSGAIGEEPRSDGSSSNVVAIDAYLTNFDLQLSFLNNYGVVSIKIKDYMGTTVYQTISDTSINPNLTINISSLPHTGIYEIYISDMANTSAQGFFSLD